MPRFRLQHETKRAVTCVAVLATLASTGCAGPDAGDADVATKQSALGAWQGWSLITSFGLLWDSAALAQVKNQPLSAFVLGTNEQIWFTNMDSNWQWTGGWTQITDGSDTFRHPVVATFPFTSGPLADAIAIVTERQSDRRYVIRIQNRSGSSVILDWSVIVDRQFKNQPALVFVPANLTPGPQNTLVLLALDGNLLEFRNTIVNGVYNHAAWTLNQSIGNTKLSQGPRAALAYACPASGDGVLLTVAAISNTGTLVYNEQSNGNWSSAWRPVELDLPSSSGVDLVTSCGTGLGSETLLFTRSSTGQILRSFKKSNGFTPFSPVDTTTFDSTPRAVNVIRTQAPFGKLSYIYLTASVAQHPFMNFALSPGFFL